MRVAAGCAFQQPVLIYAGDLHLAKQSAVAEKAQCRNKKVEIKRPGHWTEKPENWSLIC